MAALNFRDVFLACARGGWLWFLVPAAIGALLVSIGRARGIETHAFYESVLLAPFLLAAMMGSVGNYKLRNGVDPGVLEASRGQLLWGTFAWCCMCLTCEVMVDWAVSKLGIPGREPNEFFDSVGMVLTLSGLFSVATLVGRIEKR